MIFESNWNFSVNDYRTMTLYENPSLNLKFFMRNETNICRNFFLNNCMRYLRAFIEFFRQTDNYCLVFIEIRSKLSSKRFVRAEMGKNRERKKGNKIVDIKAYGIEWQRCSIERHGLIPCFYFETEIHGSRCGVVSINTVYQFSLYPNFLVLFRLRSSWEFARRQSSGLVISG